MIWHQMTQHAVLREVATDFGTGLSDAEATRRLIEHGRNEISASQIRSPWRILWEQLIGLMTVILIVAAIVSAILRDFKDAAAIAAIVILNTVLSFSQEYRAERAIAALKKLAAPSAKVRRDGRVVETEPALLVPGDIVLLEAGNSVAADCRVMESADLRTLESALTGESETIQKITDAIPDADIPLGDRRNMVYAGTLITAGRGLAIVIGTGMRTELGRIAGMMRDVDHEPTPLQRRLHHLGKRLATVALLLVGVIFAIGLIRGEELHLLFLTAVSIGVAAVPEGLPAVVTIALTLGAQRMLSRRVLVRRLQAVETLGSVTVICSDKTGTLTENRMTVTTLQTAGHRFTMPGDSLPVAGEKPEFSFLLAGAALCNDSVEVAGSLKGDPTETALIVAAERFGLMKADLEMAFPRIAEVPFTSERKRMTTVHRVATASVLLPFERRLRPGHLFAFTKGAVDSLLEISSTVWIEGRAEPINNVNVWREQLRIAHERLASEGARVLGVAFRSWDADPQEAWHDQERELTFVGMIGITDPPRAAALSAVEKCRSAGIRPVMITGDHPLTAACIARQIGIGDNGAAVTGKDLDRQTASELEHTSEAAAVYARVSPEHKLKIVQALQGRGHVVAMTGDGVNDAPALRKANIGVAMGIAGTDVARAAADMILLDDNFASIVAAVEEGRVVYDNARKFIRYILATNSAEIWVMLAAPLLGMPLPLLPLQILWMNLVTDGLPALALAVEPAEIDTMRRPPYPTAESIFARGLGRQVLWVGLMMSVLCLAAGYWYWRAGNPNWQTILLTTLTLSQMANVMAVRSERRSIFQIGLLSNKPLLGAVCLTVLLQLGLLYVPFLREVFKTRALRLSELAVSVAFSLIVFAAVELEKQFLRDRAA